MKNKRSLHLLAIGTTLVIVLHAPAQTAPGSGAPANAPKQTADAVPPSVDSLVKSMTETVGLTSDQQSKIKPILEALRDATDRLVSDQSLTQEERLEKVQPLRFKARDHILTLLSDEQKPKFDQFIQEHHAELHGGLNGQSQQPKQ